MLRLSTPGLFLLAVNPLAPLGLGFGGAVAAGQAGGWELGLGMASAASPAHGAALLLAHPKGLQSQRGHCVDQLHGLKQAALGGCARGKLAPCLHRRQDSRGEDL